MTHRAGSETSWGSGTRHRTTSEDGGAGLEAGSRPQGGRAEANCRWRPLDATWACPTSGVGLERTSPDGAGGSVSYGLSSAKPAALKSPSKVSASEMRMVLIVAKLVASV